MVPVASITASTPSASDNRDGSLVTAYRSRPIACSNSAVVLTITGSCTPARAYASCARSTVRLEIATKRIPGNAVNIW